MAKRYAVKLSRALPEEKRDVRKKLRHSETWRDGKRGGPSEWATGSVELTPSEVAKVEAASNVVYVEEAAPVTPHVDASVPSDTDLRGHKADMLFEWGFTGQGIDVGVIDTGIGSGVIGKFNVKANRAFDAITDGNHGSYTASLAVPRNARLVFATAVNTASISDAIYWMTDEIGVHVINMSFGTYTFSQAMADALSHARSKGVALRASAGNEGSPTPQYPAHNAGVVAVGALDRSAGWKRASFSNYGSWVDLWTNGVSVATYDGAGNLTYQHGTSVAAPLATFVYASLATKGLTSIGQIGTDGAMGKGSDGVPAGLGGGKRINGEKGAFAMRDFCG